MTKTVVVDAIVALDVGGCNAHAWVTRPALPDTVILPPRLG